MVAAGSRPSLAALVPWVTALGAAALAAAVGWWWLVFHPLIAASTLSFAQAMPCLAVDSDRCSLAQVLCAHPHLLDIRRYWPEALWIGIALLSATPLLCLPRQP